MSGYRLRGEMWTWIARQVTPLAPGAEYTVTDGAISNLTAIEEVDEGLLNLCLIWQGHRPAEPLPASPEQAIREWAEGLDCDVRFELGRFVLRRRN